MSGESGWAQAKSWFGLSTNQRNWSHEVAQMAALYCDPVIMTIPADKSVLESGSGFLFKPEGDRTFLVTNSHVLSDGYEKIEAKYGSAEFRFGEQTFVPNVVSRDPDEFIDIAVIDVTGIEFANRPPGYWGSTVGSLTPYAPTTWPLDAGRKGESICIVGWPQKFRVRDGDAVEYAAFPMGGQQIGDVTDNWFVIPFEREHWTSSDFDPNNPVVLEKTLGGMSGSPVFALHRSGVVPLQLIGIVRTYGEAFDVLYCTRASILAVDGTLHVKK
jgi:hypothetical protein